jgi:hypothetical protein
MRVHHLNCISTCPLGGRLMDGHSVSILRRGELACHCLLVETRNALRELEVCCGHDLGEFERFAGYPARAPAPPRVAWPAAMRGIKAHRA